MKRKNKLLAMGIALAMGLSACQKSPESSIVVNKDLDNLIEKAQEEENGAGIEDMKAYDTYQITLEDDSLGVTVNVDAKVDIPETDKMSVIRVKQNPVSQELLDQVRKELVGDKILYDGALTVYVKTRSDLETEISSLKSELEAMESWESEENLETYREEFQRMIDEYQEEYENAPAEIVWEGNESDNLLHSAAEQHEKYAGNDFYSWKYNLAPDGDIYYGVRDGKDGSYISLLVQNSEDYGNAIRYRNNKEEYDEDAAVVLGASNLEDPYATMLWRADEEPPADLLQMTRASEDGSLTAYEEEPISISLEEAQRQAEEFLQNTGLEEYQYYEGGLYDEVTNYSYDGTNVHGKYRTRYILRYVRNIDGAFVTYDGTSKFTEGWEGNEYVKKFWPAECIEFRIDDDGIIGFDYIAPIEELETVVDQSGLKSFDEVKSIFEQMVIVTNASEDSGVSIQIDRVALGYARISEADSYDTGLLVPVWDFQGTKTKLYGDNIDMTSHGSILTINAIDGSIIDRALGY